MCYYPHMPGNSCSVGNISINAALQDAHMNPAVVRAARQGSVEEVCAVFTLSEILDHYIAGWEESVGEKRDIHGMGDGGIVPAVHRIALLKIDVEGDEYDVLRSISPAHWQLVGRVIVESHPVHTQSIIALLISVGFAEGSISFDSDCTGNYLIYAFR